MRLAIVQPTLAKYRVPIFASLAKCPGIDLTVYYAKQADVDNAAAIGFVSVVGSCVKILGLPLFWNWLEVLSVASKKHDCVVIPWNTRFLTMHLALVISWMLAVPVVLWGHGHSKRERPFTKWFRNWVGRRARAVLVYDDKTARSLRSRLPHVFVARNTMDTEAIVSCRRQWDRRHSELKEWMRLRCESEGPYLLFCSRLLPANRLDLLALALPGIVREFPDVTINVIGRGDEEVVRIRALAGNLERHFRFRGAIYEEEQLAPWFLGSDLMVYPDNLGLTAIHSLAYGLPVVTCQDYAAHGPEAQCVVDGETGFHYRRGCWESLRDRILQALRGGVSPAMRARAIEVVEAEYSVGSMVAGITAAASFATGDLKGS